MLTVGGILSILSGSILLLPTPFFWYEAVFGEYGRGGPYPEGVLICGLWTFFSALIVVAGILMLKRVHFTEVVEILIMSVIGIICIFYPVSLFTLPAILALIFAVKCKHEFYDSRPRE